MTWLRTLFRRAFGGGIPHPERLVLSGALRAINTHTIERD